MIDESPTAAQIRCLQEGIEHLRAENERYKILFGQIALALKLGEEMLNQIFTPVPGHDRGPPRKPDA